ncbi:IPT/TIG domain-containing protein [Kineococcus rhizosphaerae]|uniref:IPT/TIG domain-containing protein n=1 Tax=Kineococcus rhizosphaerae TaxID=559628 RepID=A0A2T0RAT3_9ACTN|nr:IPT/TIG domain-containing protein [Kineococcus rhizosphaerae]PRY18241.1 IPT/TIG domain-containing protein [Kineococcus rhizosphaerae]
MRSTSTKTTLRMAAVFTGFALSAGLAGPAFAAAPAAAPSAFGAAVASADAPAPSTDAKITRLSTTTGPQAGGNKVVVFGTNLTTGSGDDLAAKAVTFGDVAVAADAVKVLSATALEVTVPAAVSADGKDAAKLAVLVKVGGKGDFKYNYTQAAPTISEEAADEDGFSPDYGSLASTIKGEGFEPGTTKVLVGGKPAKATVTVVKSGDDSILFDAPAGLTGIQDVLVTTKGGTAYAGFVDYEAVAPAFTTDVSSGLTTLATTVTVKGTALDLVTTATLNIKDKDDKDVKVPVAVKKNVDATTKKVTSLTLTVPKLAATIKLKDATGVTGDLVLNTKYGSSTSGDDSKFEWDAPEQATVSKIEQAAGATGKTKFTVTGEHLTGLVSITLTPRTGVLGKTTPVTASLVKVASDTSATFEIPTLAAGSYDAVVKTTAATDSDKFEVVSAGLPATLTKATYTETTVGADKKPVPARVTLGGTNLSNSLTARVYLASTSADDLADVEGVAVKATAVGAATIDLAGNLPAGDYKVDVSIDGKTWGTATTFKIAAQTLTKVTVADKLVTFEGTNFTKATVARVFGSDATDDEKGAGAVFTTFGAAKSTLTLSEALTPGDYTAEVSLDGKTWVAKDFTIAKPLAVSDVAYDGKVVTLTGDSFDTVTAATLFKGTTDTKAAWDKAKGTFTLGADITAGTYKVTLKAGTTVVTKEFTVAAAPAPALETADYTPGSADADGGISFTGTDLPANVKVRYYLKSDGAAKAVETTVATQDGTDGWIKTYDYTDADAKDLASGVYVLQVWDGAKYAEAGVEFTVSA